MKSLWDDAEAAKYRGALGPRVYSSRLLGGDPSLVLHGGGNTSLKLVEKNVFGEDEEVLYVKGSGRDLGTIEPEDFSPVALAPLRRLAALPALGDREMMNELATRVLRTGAPAPSVETLLHAALPHAYVDHTHADAILSLGNTPEGGKRVQDLYGDEVVVVPYVMPGFALAARCAQEYRRQAGGRTIGMVLLAHGVVSFGADARESYERMIALVARAETHLASRKAWQIPFSEEPPPPADRMGIVRMRREISDCAGSPLLLRVDSGAKALAFARRPDVAQLSQRGPATPDHVLYTKPQPMLGRDVAAFATAYQAYFERNVAHAGERKVMLDPAPRVVLDPQIGLAAAGRTATEATIAAELYDHTIDVILRAEALGGWRSIGEREIFEVEYWTLEQAKLRRVDRAPPFAGEAVLVTGAASGIGRACVEAFLRRGAAVVALDLNPDIAQMWDRPEVLGLRCDLTDVTRVDASLDAAVRRFGGLDMLVLNAGVFPGSQPLERVAPETWRKTMALNVEANLELLQLCHPLLAASPRGGRVVVIGSRNVPAPGPGAAAYSASKAAMNQLARVAALEWAKDRIRVNSLHPDAVYDTGLWTEELLASRAKAYGMTVEQYKRKNLLRTEVSAKDVAELAAEVCGPLFSKTTGAQLPIDGGNERVV